MRRKLTGTIIALSTAFLLATPAWAEQDPTTKNFVTTVAVSDMFEVQSGELARDQARNADVKSFGKQMVEDHTKTSDELKALIDDQDLDVELPQKLDSEHQAKLDKLKGLSEQNQFDEEYIRTQVDAHKSAVALFSTYAAGGGNDALKGWAQETLPKLKAHLEHAQKLQAAVEQEAKAEGADQSNAKRSDSGDESISGNEDAKKPARKSNIKYITRQTANDWTAEALIGRTVENAQGDNLGEINNVIINEKGDVVAVVIGVGGFLGIGEKNVGVPFDALDFRTDLAEDRAEETKDERAAEAKDEKRAEETKDERAAEAKGEKRAEEAKDERAAKTKDDQDGRKGDSTAARFDSEHKNVHIVLNTTKEDLEGAPPFAWLDEQDGDRARE